MDYTSAANAVEMWVTGQVSPKTMRTTEWLNAKGGYSALATTAGPFKVLQVNWPTAFAACSDEQPNRSFINFEPSLGANLH